MPPDDPSFVPDCGFCHDAARPAPSFAALLPDDRVVLEVAGTDAAFRTRLADALAAAGVDVRDAGAPVVRVAVTRLAGDGRTPGGAAFRSVRYDAPPAAAAVIVVCCAPPTELSHCQTVDPSVLKKTAPE